MGIVGEILEIALGALIGLAGDTKRGSQISNSASGKQGYEYGQEARKSYEKKVSDAAHSVSNEQLKRASQKSDLNKIQKKVISDEMKKRGL